MKTITTTSEKQTVNLGKKFAKQIKHGLIIGLVGELGAGKTQFVKGIALGLGIKNNITSPTFVLLKAYEIFSLSRPSASERRDPEIGANYGIPRLPRQNFASQNLGGFARDRLKVSPKKLVHIDCYRLSSPEELLDIGWKEFINNPKNIVVVEWADKIRKIMPKRAQWIEFKAGKKENERAIKFK